MGTPAPLQARVRFRSFTLDRSTSELRRSGIRVKLHGQPIAILKMLLDHPGQIISRESLRHVLWAENTFVEFDHGLNSNINRLRSALGDCAGAPRFIETVPGLGYRFIAPISSDVCATAERELPRLIVLPFTCMAGAFGNFAEAITAQIIVALAEMPRGIRIVSSASWPNRHTARLVNTDYVLAGAIFRDPLVSRICVQLIRTSDSCCIWGGNYVHCDANLFSTLNQIAMDVSAQVLRSTA